LFNKIFEIVIYKLLITFLDKHDFLFKRQYGFRKGSGTHTANYEILNKVFLDKDKGKKVSALFIDLTKAFDCVSHEILILKMERAGIRESVLNLLQRYLNGRKQCVCIGDSRSSLIDISIGVPPG